MPLHSANLGGQRSGRRLSSLLCGTYIPDALNQLRRFVGCMTSKEKMISRRHHPREAHEEARVDQHRYRIVRFQSVAVSTVSDDVKRRAKMCILAVIAGEIKSASFFMSAKAASGRDQFTTLVCQIQER